MANLNVTSHTPTINETGVYRNEVLRIYFDRPIQPNTVTWDTISVHDNASYTTAPGSLGVEWTSSGTVVQATFTPETNLSPNTEYSVYVFEKPSIVAIDGSELATTYTWNFTTGIEEYDEDAASGIIPSGDLPVSGSEIDLSGIVESVESGITSFDVYTTNPLNQEPMVAPDIARIYVTFTGNISTSLEDISGYVSVEEMAVL